jgi:adenylosuccinate synthase
MFNRIILLSGPISSGKSTLAKGLADRYGMSIFKTSEILKKYVRRGSEQDRKILQAQGERLDRKTHGRWVLEELREWSNKLKSSPEVIVDSVRITEQIQAIREAYGQIVIHVHLTAPMDELEQRFSKRREQSGNCRLRTNDFLRKTLNFAVSWQK